MTNKRVIKTPIKKVSDINEVVKRDKPLAGPTLQTQAPDFRKYLNTFEFTVTLPGSGKKVTLKPMTTADIKKLLQYEGLEDDFALMTKIFDDMINESVISTDFDYLDLYLQDRFFLLFEIRKASKGTKHQFEFICPECNSQTLITNDLENVKITKMKDVNKLIDLNENISIEIDFLKRKNEFEATKALQTLKDSGEQYTALQKAAELSLLLEASGIKRIITPEGSQENLTIFDKKYFLENVPNYMHQKVKDWYSDSDFGVDLTVKFKCNHCDYKLKTDIQFDNFFF
jgi:hypothetical protein